MHMTAQRRLQAALDAEEGVDERRLFDHAIALPGSRLLTLDGLSEVHFVPASSWELSTGVRVVAALKFKHAEWGEKKMYFESRPQLGEAADVFRELLGRDFRDEVVGAITGS
jgi:hypothetical protein